MVSLCFSATGCLGLSVIQLEAHWLVCGRTFCKRLEGKFTDRCTNNAEPGAINNHTPFTTHTHRLKTTLSCHPHFASSFISADVNAHRRFSSSFHFNLVEAWFDMSSAVEADTSLCLLRYQFTPSVLRYLMKMSNGWCLCSPPPTICSHFSAWEIVCVVACLPLYACVRLCLCVCVWVRCHPLRLIRLTSALIWQGCVGTLKQRTDLVAAGRDVFAFVASE